MNTGMNLLSMLKTGDIVLSTKGSYGIVLKGTANGDIIKWLLNNKKELINKFRSFRMLNEDLTFKYDGKDNRIIKVWRTDDNHYVGLFAADDFYRLEERWYKIIYEEQVKEVTMDEVEEKFGCKVKIKNNK